VLEPAVDLAELLVPESWEFCVDPFPHVRAARVFTDAFHHELATAFDAILRGQRWPAFAATCRATMLRRPI
jgi:hypothetical protein